MTKQHWKKIESKYILKNRWLNVREDRCLMPSKKEVSQYFVLELSDWVNVVARTPDGMIVMVRQYRHGIEQSFLELPSGYMEKNENPLEAAKRELLEETGYSSDDWGLLCEMYPNPALQNNKTTTFFARDAKRSSHQKLDETEDIEVELVDPKTLLKMIDENQIKNPLYLAALFYAFKELNLT